MALMITCLEAGRIARVEIDIKKLLFKLNYYWRRRHADGQCLNNGVLLESGEERDATPFDKTIVEKFKNFFEDNYDIWQDERDRAELVRLGQHLELNLDSQLYLEARTFAHLVEANRLFILGELKGSFYYCGPLDDETRSLVPGLLRLHNRGIFTNGSQPFYSSVQCVREKRSWPLIVRVGEFQQDQQRPLLDMIVPGDGLNRPAYTKLVEKLQCDARLIVRAIDVTQRKVIDGHVGFVRTDRSRCAAHHTELESVPWHYGANDEGDGDQVEAFSRHAADLCDEDLFRLPAMMKAMPIMIRIISKQWDVYLDPTSVVLKIVEKEGISFQ